MTVLVTGGLGYIGSNFARLATQSGLDVVIVDDESTGLATRNPEIPRLRLDVSGSDAAQRLAALMTREHVDSVVHFAALKRVDESIAHPVKYYRQNVIGLAAIIDAMVLSSVSDIVFSSTAAVYGATERESVNENSPTQPINAYGGSKLAGEWMLEQSAAAHGLRAISLRYFNVAGAGWPDLGDTGVSNLIPIAFDRIEQDRPPVIFGDDYPTPDGTGIRDYVHVLDVAEAHLCALRWAADSPSSSYIAMNVGTGSGSSVREVIAAIERRVGGSIEPTILARRPGDPPRVVADPSRLERLTGWRAKRGLAEIVDSAWLARSVT